MGGRKTHHKITSTISRGWYFTTKSGGVCVLLASMAAYIGLAPRTDLTWDLHPPAEAMQLLAEGQIDAFMAFPPFAQELRAKQIGRVVVNSAVDRPWSQYFCCIIAGNRE